MTRDADSSTRSKLSRTSSSRFPPSTLARRSGQPTPLLAHAKHAGDGRGDQGRIVEHTQIDEPDAVRKVLQQVGGGLDGHAGLADASRPSDREEPDILTAQQVNNPSNLILATEKRGRFHREVVQASGQGSNRREVGSQVRVKQLEDVLRSVEITQRVFTEVAQARTRGQGIASQVLRHQCEEDLTTVGSGHQAGEAIESRSEVVPVTRLSGGSVQRHADGECATHLGPAIRCQ